MLRQPPVFSVAPITARIRRRLGLTGENSFAGASERLELAPSARIFSPRLISLPNETDRAIASSAIGGLKAMRALEREGEHLHAATIAYRFDNALLADGCYYSNGQYGVGTPSQYRRPIIWTKGEIFEEAQLSTDMGAELFFGHWLCDALCTELLALDRQLPGLTYAREPYRHEPGYRELVELPGIPISLARVKKLWVVDDRGINHNRADRFRRLRSRLRNGIGNVLSSPRFVFILRGSSGVERILHNEMQIAEVLSNRGFEIIDPLKLESKVIAQRLVGTKIVISVEGSHKDHALPAMPEGGCIIHIQPPRSFMHGMKFLGDVANIRTGFVVADQRENGFNLDPERLLRTLDLVMSEIQ
jgi:Glycosyltransferase 61